MRRESNLCDESYIMFSGQVHKVPHIEFVLEDVEFAPSNLQGRHDSMHLLDDLLHYLTPIIDIKYKLSAHNGGAYYLRGVL